MSLPSTADFLICPAERGLAINLTSENPRSAMLSLPTAGPLVTVRSESHPVSSALAITSRAALMSLVVSMDVPLMPVLPPRPWG